MEIGPIPGIRALPAVKARPVAPQLTALFEIDETARPDESEWTDGRKTAAGAEEDEELTQEEAGAETDAPAGRVSYFA